MSQFINSQNGAVTFTTPVGGGNSTVTGQFQISNSTVDGIIPDVSRWSLSARGDYGAGTWTPFSIHSVDFSGTGVETLNFSSSISSADLRAILVARQVSTEVYIDGYQKIPTNDYRCRYPSYLWGDSVFCDTIGTELGHAVGAATTNGFQFIVSMPALPQIPGNFNQGMGSGASCGQIDLSWDSSASSTGYTIEYRYDNNDTWKTVIADYSGLTYSWTPLSTPSLLSILFEQYQFRIRGENWTYSEWSSTEFFNYEIQEPNTKSGSDTSIADTKTEVTLNWTNGSTCYDFIEIYRCPLSGAGCIIPSAEKLLATITGTSTSYIDTDVCSGIEYTYDLRGGMWSPVSGTTSMATPIGLIYVTPVMNITTPSNGGVKDCYIQGNNLILYNSNTTGTGVETHIQRSLTGTGSWSTIHIETTLTTINKTFRDYDIDYGVTYYYRIANVDKGVGCIGGEYSNIRSFTFNILSPSTITASTNYDTPTDPHVDLDWDQPTDYSCNDGYNVYRKTTGNYTFLGNTGTLDFIDDNGLIDGTEYTYKVCSYVQLSGGSTGESCITIVHTYYECNPIYEPTDLSATTINLFNASFSWIDNSIDEDGFYFQYWNGNIWITVATLPSGTTTYDWTGLEPATSYTVRVVAYNSYCNYISNEIEFETFFIPEPWCSLDTPYTVTDSTCGNSNGIVTITNYDVYKDFYNYTLTLPNGGTIHTPNSSGEFTTLIASYWFLTATPITSYLRDTCEFKWIEVHNSDTVIGLTGSTITNAICGSFNQQEGRTIFSYSGLTFGNIWNVTFYNSKGELLSFYGNTGNVLIVDYLKPDHYYVLIREIGAGDCIFLHNFTIKEEIPFSVPNIKEIYVSEWDENVDWNYWSTENDPDYYGGLDTLKFQSTKIKEFLNTNQWYYIPVDEQNVSFDQSLSKVRQGFIFTDTLTIAVDNNNTAKWKQLTSVLKNRYVVVFKDNNDNWWTFGFEHGAETKDYSFGSDLGGLKFSFSSHSENRIITALNIDYIQTNILT